MKKAKLLLVLALSLFSLNGALAQVSQWEVYNSIPNLKSISFVFSDADVVVGYKLWNEEQQIRQKRNDGNMLQMSIYDDYSVELRYTSKMRFCEGKETIPVSITGSGMVRWQNDRMLLDLDVRMGSSGGTDNLCSDYSGSRYGDVYSSHSYSFSYSEKSARYTYMLVYDERGFFVLSGDDIDATIEGRDDYFSDDGNSRNGIPVLYKAKIQLTGKALRFSKSEKSQSELNAQNSDMYGQWQWNDDRSVIYLASTTKEVLLVLWNQGENIYWGFQMDEAATGYKTETTEDGAELVYLMLTFDGGTEQSFTFQKSSDGVFLYVQYDRFWGNMKHDASILGQVKDKRTMIMNYKQNGSSKTAMFRLEGLESIYNAITQ